MMDRSWTGEIGDGRVSQEASEVEAAIDAALEMAPVRARARVTPDVTTLLGLAAAFGILGVAMVAESSLSAFLNPAALLLVLGGTLAVTLVSFPLSDVRAAWREIGATLILRTRDPRAFAWNLLVLADAVRRNGPEAIRDAASEFRDDPYLRRAHSLIAEGLPPEAMAEILGGELETQMADRLAAVGVLRRAAEVAPAMGLIGTLIGLVQMLGKLQDPAAIGPAMAIALLTTFYGAVFGNMVLHPLAGKIERKVEADAFIGRLCLAGAVSIARRENPKRLELALNAALPPGGRLRLFNKDPA